MPKTATAEEAEVDYTAYVDKEPTDLQSRFGDWIIEKTEITFATKKEEAAFRKGVTMSTQLRMKFQASPENQEVNGRAARAARLAAQPVKEPKAEKPAKSSKAAATAPEETPAPAVAKPAAKGKKGGGKAPF